MESRKAMAYFLLLCVLFLTCREMATVEARLCKVPSGRYRGPCVRDTKCAEVCMSEGFGGGDCKGIRRRCMCYKQC
ncbi:Defensin-like protein 1 [Acorus gramineus]|uniref:Defensin-like protein 1 n=1 Tax=Acorus gramineus TaxID=55184 RepID=A0AAV8ZW96_ACOGR|nr:Defensin-like protein 1 [Acorus gramineus]